MSTAIEENKKERRGIGHIIGIILCVILIPILAMNVTIIIKGVTTPQKVPTVFGYAPLIVLTDSMYPDIQSGDLIIVHSADAGDVKEGDVISFFDPDGTGMSVVTHRVADIETVNGNIRFITKGDANNAEDPSPVPAESLVGIYRTRIAGAGNIAMFLQSAPGLIVCIAIPLVLLVAYEILSRRKNDRKRDEDTQALLAELEELRAKQKASEDAPVPNDTASENGIKTQDEGASEPLSGEKAS